MKLLFIGNGNGLSSTISGGAVRIIEILARWAKTKNNLLIDVWTTLGGYKMLNNNNIKFNCDIIWASIWVKDEKHRGTRFWSYIVSTIHSALKVLGSKKIYDAVYTGSDFFCDVIPAYFMKIKNANVKWICNIHHKYLPPSRRDGIYIINLLSWIMQKFSFTLISKKADMVFVYDTEEGDETKKILCSKGLKGENVSYMYNGINIDILREGTSDKKCYECCFIGGLRPSKGIKDFIPIWSNVVKSFPDARLVAVGHYDRYWGDYLINQAEQAGLKKNVILTGYVTDEDKIKYLKSSKIFISPSHEEGWGIAICEALACGIPVIAYDLEAYRRTFGEFIKIVPAGNIKLFADAIIEKLNTGGNDIDVIKDKIIQRYNWDNIAKNEFEVAFG